MRSFALVTVIALTGVGLVAAAEPGDFDGDGRISIADVIHRALDDIVPAPGSEDGLDVDPYVKDSNVPTYVQAAFTYLEFLRRSVHDPLPHWTNTIQAWNRSVPQDPLPTDARISLALEAATAPGGEDGRFLLSMRLHASVGVWAFSIILDSPERILRIDFGDLDFGENDWTDIRLLNSTRSSEGFPGDLFYGAPAAGFLATNGRYVINRGLVGETERNRLIAPGFYTLAIPVRLPKGTPAGKYTVQVLPNSEVFLEDGTVGAPEIGLPVEVTVEKTVTAGWDEGVPPLRLDPETKQVLGKVQFRIADKDGVPPGDGQPVVRAARGEDVTLRVQMRTEVPLNAAGFRVEWDKTALRCTQYGLNDVEVLFRSPEDGKTYKPYGYNADCESGWILPPNFYGDFRCTGDIGTVTWQGGQMANYPDRPLEYFKPLGEWTDVQSAKIHVLCANSPGTRVPVRFRPFDLRDGNEPGLEFTPYRYNYWATGGFETPNWSYDIEYQDASIEVTDAPPICPDDPIDVGLRIALGKAVGKPGESVEVPITASAEHLLWGITLVVQSDLLGLRVAEAVLNVQAPGAAAPAPVTISPGGYFISQVCSDPQDDSTCAYGFPWAFSLDTDPAAKGDFDALYITAFGPKVTDLVVYPGTSPVEIGRLRFQIPPDAADGEYHLKPISVQVPNGPFMLTLESHASIGGNDFPPKAFIDGLVIVDSRPDLAFIRGDANLDGAVDVTDPIRVLSYLFQGGDPLGCDDAADIDASGRIEITDPILLLGALFLGSGQIPPPFPVCGPHPGVDRLGCKEPSCRP